MKPELKIVKIGGRLIEEEKLLQEFLNDFSRMEGPKILVHGGGILATQLSEKLGFPTTMLNGRRITDETALKVILMTYAGLVNKNLVAGLQARNAKAIGLCGADGGSIIAVKRPASPVDYGFVGDVEEVDEKFITSLLQQGLLPVFSAISCTREGQLLNTNADSIATAIARAMASEFEVSLYFLMEKKGVLLDVNDESSLVADLNTEKYNSLLSEGRITDGMLPKLHNCFQALENNVSTIYLGNGSLIRNSSTGTKITR